MFIEFKSEVESVLHAAFKKAGFGTAEIPLEESEHADLATSAAFRLASLHKKNPKEIAETVKAEIHLPENSLIGKVETIGGYINFFTSKQYLKQTLERIQREKNNFANLNKTGKVIIEHTSANPNGPLHVGHIRNSIIGDTLTRILKKAGYEVEVQYYVNDMGRQIAVVSWGLKHFKLNTSKKPDHAIADIYIQANRLLEEQPERKEEIDTLMRRVEQGEEETIKSFDKAAELAMQGIRETLSRMNIHHDRFVEESSFVLSGAVKEIVEEIKGTGRVEEDNGALVVNLSDFGIEKNLVIQRSDGTSLYTTRDLAYHKWKADRCDWMIDVLGADHKLISTQLKLVLRTLGVREPDIVIFEFVSLPEGSMSTRRGVFISADELLDEIEKHALEEVSKRRRGESSEFKKRVAEMVGIGAVRYDVVKVSADKSTVFDWREALDFEKQGAPFIQYAHARACSILRKAASEGYSFKNAEPHLLTAENEQTLIKKMAYLSNIIDTAARELKPHILAIYARELADAFNQFYRDSPVLQATPELRAARLLLVDCARITLKTTLETLGIAAPEEM
jgi:arginyl-tRNA synthetase